MPAYIYPGQGSQSVGMGRALAATSAEAAAVWQQVDEAIGEPISRLAWEGPAQQLDLTINAQPALLAASIAAQRALEASLAAPTSTLGPPSYFAGHSMGQYSAMVAAGVLDLGDAARLVRERGRLMQASSGDGAMAAIIGLPGDQEDELMAVGAAEGIITIANRNSPGQIVDQRPASGGRGRGRGRQGTRRPQRHGPARQRGRPLAAHGRRRRGHAPGPRGHHLRHPDSTAAG